MKKSAAVVSDHELAEEREIIDECIEETRARELYLEECRSMGVEPITDEEWRDGPTRRPLRELMAEAIQKATQGKYGSSIIRDLEKPEESISVDAALLVLMKVELYRWRRPKRLRRYTLRELVREVARSTRLDARRRHAYEVVVMNYYSIVKMIYGSGSAFPQSRSFQVVDS